MKYSISKDLPYSIKTTEDALQFLEMMEQIMIPICNTTQDIKYNFSFDIGNISCSSDDKGEFIQEIFGQTDFALRSIHIYAFPKNKNEANSPSTCISWDRIGTICSFMFSSDSKDILIKLDRLYNIQTEKAAKQTSETVAIGTYIDQSQHVSINGNINNAAIGDNNTVINLSNTDSHNTVITPP